VRILNPRTRVPVSLIIDDSTCLVNLAHFCIPHFAEAYPDRYRQPWKSLPREIPDRFVRKFGDWCREHGVKGKYSVIPYPACVGWLDRDLPGWSRSELRESLALLRTELASNWDFHPEMISHTWILDLSTGRPVADCSHHSIENWWGEGQSTDHVAAYMAYAMRILRDVGIECEGITTPGGFGNRCLPELSQATLEACRAVYGAEIPHYFRHVFTDERSVAPRIEYAAGLEGTDPRCSVSIIGCTGDWFGGWDGLSPGNPDLCITADLKGGRLPEVIGRGEPAILVCHWPGIYYNGEEVGFRIFQEVVERLHAAYDHLLWMKLSEISRYWAAKALTRIERSGATVTLDAPFGCPIFTVAVHGQPAALPRLVAGGNTVPLREVRTPLDLDAQSWVRQGSEIQICFDLPRGRSTLEWS
jgi:hypothetical protein